MTMRSSTSALAFAGTLSLATVAAANPTIEVGGTLGVHTFSDSNELGVFDEMGVESLTNSGLFGLRLGVIFNDVIGIEGEAGIMPTSARMLDFNVLNLTYRAHLILQYSKIGTGKVVPFLVGGIGAFHVQSTDNAGAVYTDTDAALYTGVGLKYRLPKGWGLRGDFRLLFPPSSQNDGATTDLELMFSFYKEFGRKKGTDNDPDRDGILGAADKCPLDPEDKDGFEDADGCPENDNDNDGVVDSADGANGACKNDPEDKDGFEDTDGCPDLDNDKDSIADHPTKADKCPNEAEDKDGFEDDDGCPDGDNDKDGIADHPTKADKCPNEPETVNGFEDDDGCPDTLPADVKKFTGVIEGITFQTSSANILAVSNAKLDGTVKVLTEYPSLKIEIHGHTDDSIVLPGSPFPDNQALSQARADAVKAYMVKKGVAEGRLTAKGFGESKPVAQIAGADGKPLKGAPLTNARAKNRRVEFHPAP